MPMKPTYNHFSGNVTSTIDLVIYPEDQSDHILKISIEERNPLNTSSHDALIIDLSISLAKTSTARPKSSQDGAALIQTNCKKKSTKNHMKT